MMGAAPIQKKFMSRNSGMYTPNLATILAARPDEAVGQAQSMRTPHVDRVNTARDKAAILAHLTIHLAMLRADTEACDGDA
jgi:hypothetical protein